MVDTPDEVTRGNFIADAQQDAHRWSGLVDALLNAFRGQQSSLPGLTVRMEGLRNKRDTYVTKVEALKRHRDRNWFRAREELEEAQREMHNAWRSVISALNKHGLIA